MEGCGDANGCRLRDLTLVGVRFVPSRTSQCVNAKEPSISRVAETHRLLTWPARRQAAHASVCNGSSRRTTPTTNCSAGFCSSSPLCRRSSRLPAQQYSSGSVLFALHLAGPASRAALPVEVKKKAPAPGTHREQNKWSRKASRFIQVRSRGWLRQRIRGCLDTAHRAAGFVFSCLCT